MSKSPKANQRASSQRISKKPRVKRNGQSAVLKPASSNMRKAPSKATKSPAENAKTVRDGSKQARLIAALRAPGGVTVDAMMRQTAWQKHSVRGFLAGVVRKKLGLDLVSEVGESGRIYRINDPKRASSAKATPEA